MANSNCITSAHLWHGPGICCGPGLTEEGRRQERDSVAAGTCLPALYHQDPCRAADSPGEGTAASGTHWYTWCLLVLWFPLRCVPEWHQQQQQPQDLGKDMAGRGHLSASQHCPSALWWRSSSPAWLLMSSHEQSMWQRTKISSNTKPLRSKHASLEVSAELSSEVMCLEKELWKDLQLAGDWL